MKMSIPADKLLHFSFSAIIVFTLAPFIGLLFAALSSLIIGLGKELIYDFYLGKGNAELGDFIANLVGIFYAIGIGIW